MKAELTTTGLNLPAVLSEEEWLDVGRNLYQSNTTLNFAAGDWWAYGQDKAYGSAKQVAARFGWEAKTLQTYASVAKAFEPSARVEGLSFSHHKTVMALPPSFREELLEVALEEDLSVEDLRRRARGLPSALATASIIDTSDSAFNTEQPTEAPSDIIEVVSTGLEERAIASVGRATAALADAVNTVQKDGFRLTVDVAQDLLTALETLALNRKSLLLLLQDEVGSLVTVPTE